MASVIAVDADIGSLTSASALRARRFLGASTIDVSAIGAATIFRGRPTGRGRVGTLALGSRTADLRAVAIGLPFTADFGGRPREGAGATAAARGLRAELVDAAARALRTGVLLDTLERDEALRATEADFAEEPRVAAIGFVERAVLGAARVMRVVVERTGFARWAVARVVVGRAAALVDTGRDRLGATLDFALATREGLGVAARFVGEAVDFARIAVARAAGFTRAVDFAGAVFAAALAGLDGALTAPLATVRLVAVDVVFAPGFAGPVVVRVGRVDTRAPVFVTALRRPPGRIAIACARSGISLIASLLICSTFCLSRAI